MCVYLVGLITCGFVLGYCIYILSSPYTHTRFSHHCLHQLNLAFCMDNTLGTFDGVVLKSCPAPSAYNSSYADPSLIQPRPTANMQHSHTGLFDRTSKCEDMASDISGMLSRAAAAQLYERAQIGIDTLRYVAHSGAADLRGVRSAPTPSCAPAYDIMDFIASSNSFNFLTCSANAEHTGPFTNNAVSASASMNGVGMHALTHLCAEHETKPFEKTTMAPSIPRLLKRSRGQEIAATDANHSQTSKFRGQSEVSQASHLPMEFNSKPLQLHDQYLKSPSDHFSPDILDTPLDSPNSPNSLSKQDSVLSAEDGDTDWSKSQSPSSKRRKTLQKRVVWVPVRDAKQLKGESPPSDLWAWRKYGQKPIKGSPYPRGYYRCSSSKGCSARKQVERSCADPTMLIVTYTSEHNHAWPISKASAANPQSTPKSVSDSKDKCQDQSEETATTSSSCEVVNENLFSSIINSASAAGEPVVSSLDSVQEEEGFCLKRDGDLCFLSAGTSVTEEDGVFDDLGELPEMSSISKGYNFEDLYRYVY